MRLVTRYMTYVNNNYHYNINDSVFYDNDNIMQYILMIVIETLIIIFRMHPKILNMV